MRIVQITPGAGDSFYCENCLRDVALVKAMRSLGHDVVLVPMYLPVRLDADEPMHTAPIFFGGINIYLQQKSNFFRKTPRWIDRLLDTPALLKWAGRKTTMTSARELGETTLSMLRAEHGRQIKEFSRLLAWLRSQDNKPDIVCLSNILLAGLAAPIKKNLEVPVLCLLQDEDAFIDGLEQPYCKQTWQLLRDLAGDIDAFVAVSRYYAAVMQNRLGLAPDRIHVVYPGVEADKYEPSPAPGRPLALGYLSRMCFDKGLDILVDAFVELKKNERLENLRLHIAGGCTANDRGFIGKICKRLVSVGLIGDVEFLTGFDRNARHSFLESISVLSVPEKKPIAYGLYLLEALAASVPVVEPAIGAFPELIEMTGGGVTFEPNNPTALAAAIEPLLLEPDYARRLGSQGRKAVLEKFNINQTALNMLRICAQTVEEFSRG